MSRTTRKPPAHDGHADRQDRPRRRVHPRAGSGDRGGGRQARDRRLGVDLRFAIRIAVLRARLRGFDVSHIHLRHVWPLPRNLGELLDSYDTVLVPELNSGQLVTLLRSQFDRHFEQLNKVTGQPFKTTDIMSAIEANLGGS